VGDLAVDDRSIRAVALEQPGSFCSARTCWSNASRGCTVMVRPARDFVHAARKEQSWQCTLIDTRPQPSRVGLMVARCPAGQVTLLVLRSTLRRSLVNRPVLLRTGGHLAATVNPFFSKVSRVARRYRRSHRVLRAYFPPPCARPAGRRRHRGRACWQGWPPRRHGSTASPSQLGERQAVSERSDGRAIRQALTRHLEHHADVHGALFSPTRGGPWPLSV
jgi:hypothetical protein